MFTMSKCDRHNEPNLCVSVGILAWNEEEAVEAALRSLWEQTIFGELARRGLQSEVILVANGCTDRTAEVARRFFLRASQIETIPAGKPGTPYWRLVEVAERGKNSAWNSFVHSWSATHAGCLFLMDADIVIHGREALWNMYRALEESPDAMVAVDQPVKQILLKEHRSFGERLSLAASGMTRTASAQISGQLYAIRATAARNIFLPRDLAACEDGFIKSLVCTDFLTSETRPDRVALAEEAAHIFQSYHRPGDLLRNQKRQMIGQTLVHLLVDEHLKKLPLADRLNLAATLRALEKQDPAWLKKLTAEHLRRVKYFWRLFPNLLRFRFERWAALPVAKRWTHAPAALAGFGITLLAAWLAFRHLKQGSLSYWPDTRSPGLNDLTPQGDAPVQMASPITLNNQSL